jgi:hypothetical protein
MTKLRERLAEPNLQAKEKEQLQFLRSAMATQVHLYREQLKDMLCDSKAVGKVQILGGHPLRYHEESLVDITDDTDDKIYEVIGDFFPGASDVTKDAFKVAIDHNLKPIVDEASVGGKKVQAVYVIPENGAIVRVDAIYWKYGFSEEGIIGSHKNVFCCLFAKSIVDHTQISLDDLIGLVLEQSGGADVKDVIDEVKEIWEKVQGLDQETVFTEYCKNHALSRHDTAQA